MKIGYSLLVDEYVDANLAQEADCHALRLCCPVCQEPIVVGTDAATPSFRHAAAPSAAQARECESLSSGLSQAYRHQHNVRARKQRLEFLEWERFKSLLGKDLLGPYKDESRVWEETSNLLSLGGGLSRMSAWHWEYIVRPSRKRLKDSVEFFAAAEKYLRLAKASSLDVPESGLRRHVHIQIAFDLMRHLVERQDLGDDYSWLFVHAYRICLGRWFGVAQAQRKESIQVKSAIEDEQQRAATASVLCSCGLDLLSGDERRVSQAIDTLSEETTEQAIKEEQIPLLILWGAEVAGEMQCTLCRLPYLSLLDSYDRPCRPPLA